MADPQKNGPADRDIDQAIRALKKGSQLLKYGRRGKPKFCPFKLSNDESTLIWYSGKQEKKLNLSQVSRIIPGQRTSIFKRHPRPEKEYQSFSLVYHDRSLDIICKDKDEAEVWLTGLKALILNRNLQKWKFETKGDVASVNGPVSWSRKSSPSLSPFDQGDGHRARSPREIHNRLGRAFSDLITYTEKSKNGNRTEVVPDSLSGLPAGCDESSNDGTSRVDAPCVSLSTVFSSSSLASYSDDLDSLGDVFIWGEDICGGLLAGHEDKISQGLNSKMDSLLPELLETMVVLDVQTISCGSRHAVLVTKQGKIFSWGEEYGGRLGHGVEKDVPRPKLLEAFSGVDIVSVACGEYHSCAVSLSGHLYTWGDGATHSSQLGHGSEASHWVPKKVNGHLEGIHVTYVSCGPWHTAAVTSGGQLFTFGGGSFGALGHGDRQDASIPRVVETLKGVRTTRVACGVWHTAAVVEMVIKMFDSATSGSSTSGMLYTWGDGDNGQLGHGDKESRLFPECVATLVDTGISTVACGSSLTVALTTSGRVYTMGNSAYGQLGNPKADGKVPVCVEGKIANCFVEQISCGSNHVAVLTSKPYVYTWGRGTNGQLGHGDTGNRNIPTLIDFLKDKQVNTVACGSNFTAIICPHKWLSSTHQSLCSGCRNPFGFRRKRHNCYNCGLVFCKHCSSRKSVKASLAPSMTKPYRVCDVCFTKLRRNAESAHGSQITRPISRIMRFKSLDMMDKETSVTSLQKPLSRFSSLDSICEPRSSKYETKAIIRSNRVFPSLNGEFQMETFNSSKIHSSLAVSKKFGSASCMTSWATSPSGMSSPFPSSEYLFCDPKNKKKSSCNQEIINLRTQVEELTFKSQHLKAELEKTNEKLEEVTVIATSEAEKCRAAKEVIWSLSTQLKGMSERCPEGEATNSSAVSIAKHTSNETHNSVYGKHAAHRMLSRSESDTESGNVASLLTGKHPGRLERVVQDEPGVYVTVASMPDGSSEIKRVRFRLSREGILLAKRRLLLRTIASVKSYPSCSLKADNTSRNQPGINIHA